jgi:hypothetical protein
VKTDDCKVQIFKPIEWKQVCYFEPESNNGAMQGGAMGQTRESGRKPQEDVESPTPSRGVGGKTAWNQDAMRRRPQLLTWARAGLILGGFASLFFTFFRLPFAPIWEGYDQFSMILAAYHVWSGGKITLVYFPGLVSVHLLFFLLFGLRNWIPNMLDVFVAVLSMWLVIFISLKVIAARFLALLPGALFLCVFFVWSTGEVHRWLSSAAVLAALAVVLEKRSARRLAIAGVFCGLASYITETQGVFAVASLTVFLIWETTKAKSGWRNFWVKIGWLFGSSIVTLLATYAYVVAKAGLHATYFSLIYFPTVIYPLDRQLNTLHAYFAGIPQLTLSNLPHLMYFLLIYSLVPFMYLVSLVCWRRWSATGEERARLLLVILVGLFLAASVAPAPSSFRLSSVAAPALIVLTYWLRGTRNFQKGAVAMLWVGTLGTMVHHPLKKQFSKVSVLNLPLGPMAFQEKDSDDLHMMAWLASHTYPGEEFFAAGEEGVFYPLGLKAVGQNYGGFTDTGFTTREQVQDSISALELHRIELIEWPPGTRASEFYRVEEDHLGPLRQYVQEHYRPASKFGDNEILQRRE